MITVAIILILVGIILSIRVVYSYAEGDNDIASFLYIITLVIMMASSVLLYFTGIMNTKDNTANYLLESNKISLSITAEGDKIYTTGDSTLTKLVEYLNKK